MNLNIAVCDDESKEIQLIMTYLKTYEMQYDDNLNISVHNSAASLLRVYTKPHMFHILFLDVEMPDINGLELAERIRLLPDRKVKIIFISNYPEYMQDSFDVQAFHYLKKPLKYEQFLKIMKRLIQEFKEDVSSRILVEKDESSVLIERSEVLYFEAIKGERNRLHLVTLNDEITVKGCLTEFESQLKTMNFILPNRSCLVNMNHVHFIQRNCIILDNNETIPLSRRREKDIKNLFSRQMLNIQQRNY